MELTEYDVMREIAVRKARREYLAFCRYVDPTYEVMWFHKRIADVLQKVFNGELQRVMLFVPPQHGKSEIISRKFPAYCLGAAPDCKIVGASYSSDLAQQFSRSIQRCMMSPEYEDIFGNPFAYGRTRNIDFFETANGGFYKAVGIGGSLTGTPADIAIIDDPVKDREEAYSETYRNRVWEWYLNVLLTRLHNTSRQILIMTRWHDDDLAGRILKAEGDQWNVISLPAIKEDNSDPDDPREIGEALWESKHSLQQLRAMEALSGRTFAALYQQHPVIDGGNIVRSEWFGHTTPDDRARLVTEPIHFFVDTAYTEKTSNDPTGIVGAARMNGKLVITSATKVYKTFPDLIKFLPDYVRANGYGRGSSIRIEPKANGISVVQQLKESTDLNVCKTPTPTESKETRLNVVSPIVECGNVILVDGAWNSEFIDEVCGFPHKPHDEYVDLLCYASDYLIQKTPQWSQSDIARLFR